MLSMKLKIVTLGLGSILGTTLLVGGVTYAMFNSTASIAGNSFAAGTMNISLTRDNGDLVNAPGPMFYSSTSDTTGYYPYDKNGSGQLVGGWAPGDTLSRYADLKNNGSLKVQIYNISATADSSNAIAAGSGSTVYTGETSGAAYDYFLQQMQITVTDQTGTVLYNGPLSALVNKGGYNLSQPFVMAPAVNGLPSVENLKFTAYLEPGIDNEDNLLQGKNFIFNFTMSARQVPAVS